MALAKVPKATDAVKAEKLVCRTMEVAVRAALRDYTKRYPQGQALAQNARLELDPHDFYEIEHTANSLVASLFSWVLAPSIPEQGFLTFEYKVPTTWFDHLKQSIKYGSRPRWIGHRLWGWFIQKLEVKLTLKTATKSYVTHYNVCPHADMEFSDPKHVRFVIYGGLEGAGPV